MTTLAPSDANDRIHKCGWCISNVLRTKSIIRPYTLPNRVAFLISRILHERGGIVLLTSQLTEGCYYRTHVRYIRSAMALNLRHFPLWIRSYDDLPLHSILAILSRPRHRRRRRLIPNVPSPKPTLKSIDGKLSNGGAMFEYLVPEETRAGDGHHGVWFITWWCLFPHHVETTVCFGWFWMGCPSCWIPYFRITCCCEFSCAVEVATSWMAKGSSDL